MMLADEFGAVVASVSSQGISSEDCLFYRVMNGCLV
jgi:hypothetical protein